MAKYSSKDLNLTVDATPMKAHIIDDVTLGIEVGTEEATAFGDTWESHISTGVSRGDPITVGGYYDDTATTGPDAKFNTLGTTVTIVLTWGGSKTSTFDAIVKRYERLAKVGEMTRYVATLLPTGEIEEA
jgi:hypothetical protein